MEATAGILKINKDFKLPARTKTYVRRPAPIKAIQMQVDFTVVHSLSSGLLYGKAGDYLVQGDFNFYPVTKHEFEASYEELRIGK